MDSYSANTRLYVIPKMHGFPLQFGLATEIESIHINVSMTSCRTSMQAGYDFAAFSVLYGIARH